MTKELKNKIFNILIDRFQDTSVKSPQIARVVDEIAEVVDKDVGEAIMRESTMGEVLKAVGLRLTSE